jgi:hypothetical protein
MLYFGKTGFVYHLHNREINHQKSILRVAEEYFI